MNATTDGEDPDRIELQFELDDVSEEHLPKHMAELALRPEQARELAAALERHVDRVADAE